MQKTGILFFDDALCVINQQLLKQIMRTSCLVMLLLLFVVNSILGSPGYGQGYENRTITLQVKETPLRDVFKLIENKAGVVIMYEHSRVLTEKKVNISVKSATVATVLNTLLQDQPVQWSIRENVIRLQLKPKTQNVVSAVAATEEDVPPPPPPVKGKVTDINGNAVSGVSVLVKGTKKGTTTDDKGSFSIDLEPSDKVLVFSFVSMKTQEIVVGTQTVINVVLLAEEKKEEEIVVVGYGTARAKDLTGAVSRVTAEDLEGAPPHSDIASMLQGRAAGVNVMVASGAPGTAVAVQIRGTASLTGNNQPLWVVDGIPQYNASGSDIATLLYDFNVNDIESVDVLKDASATAIYGSRAANGVIIVTTKKGNKYAKPQIDFSYNLGIQAQRDNFRMLNTQEFIDVITATARNHFYTVGTVGSGGVATIFDPTKVRTGMEIDYYTAPISPNAFFNGTTDWWNELTQNAMESKYDVSVRGGSAVNNYYLSVGISDQEGIVKGSKRTGFTARFNFDTKIGNNLKIGTMINGAFSKTDNKDNMIDKIWNFRPDFPMYDESGKIYDPGYNEENPLTNLKSRNAGNRKGLNASAFLEYRPINELVFRSSYSVSFNQSLTDRYIREGTAYATHSGQANMTSTESINRVFENTVSYNKTFAKKHNVVALAGFTMEEGTYTTFGAGVQNFPDQDIMTNLSSGTTPLKPTSTYTAMGLVSALSRVNYKFKDRYMATFTFRSDGSSRFGPDKRWGFFPSGAVAWVISDESFMKENLSFVNYLKLRSSFGRSGSQVLGNNDWQTLYIATQYTGQPGMTPTQLGNPELMWERTTTFDAGIDFAFLKDRLRGSIGMYSKLTDGIIYNKGIPSSSAFLTVKQNVATIVNRGVEFDISYDLIKTKDVTFTLAFNVARNRAKCLDINGFDSVISIYSGSALAMRLKKGEPLAQWIGYEWSGRFYQSMEEYNLLSSINPTTGAKIWYQLGNATVRPGDLKFNDVNGDGVVTVLDQVPLASAQPKFFGGFNPSFRYKSLSLQANFTYSFGAKRYWYTNTANWYGAGLFLKNYPAYVLDSWSPENRDANWPRMSFGQGSSNTFSDYWLSPADYFRLKLIRLNYRLPKNLIKINLINSIDLSLTASNIFTLTNYNGIDPEGNFSLTAGGIAGVGTDMGTYPSMRSYNVMVRFSLR